MIELELKKTKTSNKVPFDQREIKDVHGFPQINKKDMFEDDSLSLNVHPQKKKKSQGELQQHGKAIRSKWGGDKGKEVGKQIHLNK